MGLPASRTASLFFCMLWPASTWSARVTCAAWEDESETGDHKRLGCHLRLQKMMKCLSSAPSSHFSSFKDSHKPEQQPSVENAFWGACFWFHGTSQNGELAKPKPSSLYSKQRSLGLDRVLVRNLGVTCLVAMVKLDNCACLVWASFSSQVRPF